MKITFSPSIGAFRTTNENEFIVRHIIEKPNKENLDETTKKNFSRQYTIVYKNRSIKVCQTMFINTLDISKQVVNIAFKKELDKENWLIIEENRKYDLGLLVKKKRKYYWTHKYVSASRMSLYKTRVDTRISGRKLVSQPHVYNVYRLGERKWKGRGDKTLLFWYI